MDIARYIILALVLAPLVALAIHTHILASRGVRRSDSLLEQQVRMMKEATNNHKVLSRDLGRILTRLEKLKVSDGEEGITPSPLLGKNVVATGLSEGGQAVRIEGKLEVLEHRRDVYGGWAGMHVRNILSAQVAGVEVSQAIVVPAKEEESA